MRGTCTAVSTAQGRREQLGRCGGGGIARAAPLPWPHTPAPPSGEEEARHLGAATTEGGQALGAAAVTRADARRRGRWVLGALLGEEEEMTAAHPSRWLMGKGRGVQKVGRDFGSRVALHFSSKSGKGVSVACKLSVAQKPVISDPQVSALGCYRSWRISGDPSIFTTRPWQEVPEPGKPQN